MDDRTRMDNLARRLEELRTRTVPAWQFPVRNVAIRSILDEVERLERRIAGGGRPGEHGSARPDSSQRAV
jgi:hypothetical protein